MTVLDPTTPLGKIRLRVGDWQDFVILPDSVYASALVDCDNDIPRTASLCAQYILATLTAKTHRKLTGQLEMWGAEHFDNYVKFLKMTILNPNLMTLAPIPYDNTGDGNPLIDFVEEWNASFCPPIVSTF